MEAALKEAQSLIGALGTYARLTIVGVWFPGFLVFCEVGYLLYRAVGGPSNPLEYLRAEIKEFDSSLIITLVSILVLSTSILFGYIARDIAFAISDMWIRRKLPPTRSLNEIISQTKIVFGKETVDEVILQYPVFELATYTGSTNVLPRMTEGYVREFCKRWLSAKAPDLNTGGMEIEINMVMGLVTPLGLLALVLYVVLGSGLGLFLSCLAVLACWFLMYRITWARNTETEQAIANFLFAHWYIPAAPEGAGDGQVKPGSGG